MPTAETARVATADTALDDRYRVAPDLDIWVIPAFSKRVLGVDDPGALQDALEQYPTRSEDEAIEPGVCQWVDGENVALKYRGNALKRSKIWLQRGDPFDIGWIRYAYTGWQWRVLPATCDVAKCAEMLPVADKYDEWCAAVGYPAANHYIVTRYVDGKHSIGWHFDKPTSIDPGSLITVVKTGHHARPFELRRRVDGPAQAKEAPFFSRVLAPGTAVIMTLEANLATQHAVPEVEDAGPSGSVAPPLHDRPISPAHSTACLRFVTPRALCSLLRALVCARARICPVDSGRLQDHREQICSQLRRAAGSPSLRTALS